VRQAKWENWKFVIFMTILKELFNFEQPLLMTI
jgi:hypothetical protein